MGENIDKMRPQKCNQLSIKRLQNGSKFAYLRPAIHLGSETRFSEAGLSIKISIAKTTNPTISFHKP